MKTGASAAVSPRVFHGADIAVDDGPACASRTVTPPEENAAPTSHPPTFTIGSLV
jgi:hypothetical protein